jgi:hypothetical protein
LGENFFFEALLLETGGSKEKTMWKEQEKKKKHRHQTRDSLAICVAHK